MPYPGGKARARYVVDVLNHPVFDNFVYIEPFVGYASILHKIERKKVHVASDMNENVINVFRHLQRYKSYPIITKAIFDSARQDYLRNGGVSSTSISAFCSLSTFNGIHWRHATYSGIHVSKDGKIFNYEQARHNYYNRLIDNATFQSTTFSTRSYDTYDLTQWTRVSPTLIYADPPYLHSRNKEFYGMNEDFDHAHFWETMRSWSCQPNVIVFISELQAPEDFVRVACKQITVTMTRKKGVAPTMIDSIFMYRPAYDFLPSQFKLDYPPLLEL